MKQDVLNFTNNNSSSHADEGGAPISSLPYLCVVDNDHGTEQCGAAFRFAHRNRKLFRGWAQDG